MRILSGSDFTEARQWMERAAKVALKSPCFRHHCGSVIVQDGKLIGEGLNGPPAGQKFSRCFKDDLPKNFKSDKTCCIHAEHRAITDALRRYPEQIAGSRLYFIRLDPKGQITKAGRPFCTICSKMALEAGLAEFTLWHEEGITVYDTDEYNKKSFEYRE